MITPWQKRLSAPVLRARAVSFVEEAMQDEIDELRAKLAEQQTIIEKLNEGVGCDTTLDHIRQLDDMQAVADAHAHRLAMYLELVCSDYGGKFWDMAISVLGEYRSDMNRIHERESPTFMGEPVLKGTP